MANPQDAFRPPLVAGPRFPEDANQIKIGYLLLVPQAALPDPSEAVEGEMVRLADDHRMYVFYNGSWHVDDGNGHVGTIVGVGPTVADQVLVDEYGTAHWDVVFRRSDGERARFAVDAVHNGNGSHDASNAAWEISGGAVTGAAVDQVTLSVALFGTGVTQVLQLITASVAGAWTVDVRRGPLVGPGI